MIKYCIIYKSAQWQIPYTVYSFAVKRTFHLKIQDVTLTCFSSSIEQLRAERLQREAEERRRAKALLERRSGGAKEPEKELNDRDRPYNSAYFPELARKRQRRDRDSWRDEILKS